MRKQTLTKSTKQRRWQGRNVRETHDSMPRSRFDGCAAQCFKPPTTSKPEDSGFWNQHEQTDNKKAEIVWQTKKKTWSCQKGIWLKNWIGGKHGVSKLRTTKHVPLSALMTSWFRPGDLWERRSVRQDHGDPLLFGWLDCRSDWWMRFVYPLVSDWVSKTKNALQKPP